MNLNGSGKFGTKCRRLSFVEIEPWNLILSPSKSGASASIELVNSLQFCWRKKIRLEGTMQFLVSSQFGHGLGRARQFVSPDMSFIFELLIWNESQHKKTIWQTSTIIPLFICCWVARHVNSADHKFSSKTKIESLLLRCIWSKDDEVEKITLKLTWNHDSYGDKRQQKTTITVNTQRTTGGHSLADFWNFIFGLRKRWPFNLIGKVIRTHTNTHSVSTDRASQPAESRPISSELKRKCKTKANKRPESDCNKLVNERRKSHGYSRIFVNRHEMFEYSFGLVVCVALREREPLSIYSLCTFCQKFIMCKYLCIGKANNAHNFSRALTATVTCLPFRSFFLSFHVFLVTIQWEHKIA